MGLGRSFFDPSFVEFSPTNTAYWFHELRYLNAIQGLQYLNTVSVTDMSFTFAECSRLGAIDVSTLQTANVTKMGSKFQNCAGLAVLDVQSFNTANVAA